MNQPQPIGRGDDLLERCEDFGIGGAGEDGVLGCRGPGLAEIFVWTADAGEGVG